MGDVTGGVNVGKSTLTAGAAVCLYNASNWSSSGYEWERIFLSSRALLGYTIRIFSPSLRKAIGGKAVLVETEGPDTTCNISEGAARSFSVSADVIDDMTDTSGSSGVSISRFSPGGPMPFKDSIFISNVGVGTGTELVIFVVSMGMYLAVGFGKSRDPNMGRRGAYAETRGSSVSLAYRSALEMNEASLDGKNCTAKLVSSFSG